MINTKKTTRGANMIDLVALNIEKAKAGDKEASQWLIQEFCSTIKNNRDKEGNPHKKPSGINTLFDEGLLDYFYSCFQSILEGVQSDIALGINKGEPGADRLSKDVILQREYEWCLEILKLKNSGRYPLIKDAKKQASRKFRVSLSAIDKAWKNPSSKYAAMISYQMNKEGK